ncbi:MAG: Rieske (2Fe-2S) protein [Deltaproteobacteria bacterium]|jgi:nitrite reductase/ring-hydroxylating ferredoxin subunit|nr:Rieske (2Fe-2S) protein [Deltaproteobacteria bacterium]
MALRLRVCRVDDVPEDGMVEFDVDGIAVPVLVVRRGSEWRATSGICPHEVVHLRKGSLDGNTVICPGHGYRFDLDSGACTPDRRLRLPVYQATVEDGEVWIELVGGAAGE